MQKQSKKRSPKFLVNIIPYIRKGLPNVSNRRHERDFANRQKLMVTLSHISGNGARELSKSLRTGSQRTPCYC